MVRAYPKPWAIAALILFLSLSTQAKACTDFNLQTPKKEVIAARSMEFHIPLNCEVTIYPKGVRHTSIAPNKQRGFTWKSKYNFVGVNAVGKDWPKDAPIDGMNEEGLTCALLWFTGAKYPEFHAKETKKALQLEDFGTWILGSFATVKEVKEALDDVVVWGKFIPQIDEIPPLHISLHDATGKSLVIEFIQGKMKVYDNKIGVLTNAPSYPWHLENLGNFLNLTPFDPKSVFKNGQKLAARWAGGGMTGLPGDWSSPSRFVKIFMQKLFCVTPKDSVEAINLAEHLLNTVDMPKGMVISFQDHPKLLDYTQWIVIKDLTNRVFYFRSYEDLNLKSIDLKTLDFKKSSRRRSIFLEKQRGNQNVTPHIK